MEDHPIIEVHRRKFGAELNRAEQAYRSFLEMNQNHDFLREVTDRIAEVKGRRKDTIRKYINSLVDPRYMDKNTLALILAAHDAIWNGNTNKGTDVVISEAEMDRYRANVGRAIKHKKHPTWRAPIIHSGIAREVKQRDKAHVLRGIDVEILRGYVKFLREILNLEEQR